MSDLISRSEAINLLCNLHIDNIAVNGKRITEYIKELPTADAVPVVRCKNCEQWGRNIPGETERIKCCNYGGYMVGENGYCLYGEKVND